MKANRLVVDIGGIEEGPQWALEFGYEKEEYGRSTEPPCPHAKRLGAMTEHAGGTRWQIPRTVHATNEGGYASTIVCLDCLLEFVNSAEFKGHLVRDTHQNKGNPEVDALVAEKVMGWYACYRDHYESDPDYSSWEFKGAYQHQRSGKCCDSWSPSTDITHAMQVADRVGLFESWFLSGSDREGWEVSNAMESNWVTLVKAPTAPYAICLAALKAVAQMDTHRNEATL